MIGPWVLGVDIGGTNVEAGIVSVAGGTPIVSARRPTRQENGPDAAVETIRTLAEELIHRLGEASGGIAPDVVGVGVGCPGPLDLDTGTIVETPHLNWDGYPIRDRVSDALDRPCVLDNDGNCAAFGEWWAGAGQGSRSCLCVTLGTGIGGGFIVDGRVWRGASGSALEIGHMTIETEGRRCPCGNRGCWETYASGPAIADRARAEVARGRASVLAERSVGASERLTAAHVHQARLEGDALATEVVTEAGRFLGVGLASLINVLGPERIVIGGGVAAAGEALLGPARDEVAARAFAPNVEACGIGLATLGRQAGVVGAAGLFVHEGQGT